MNTPLFAGNELKYVQQCIETGWISSEGPFVAQFESAFSKYNEREFGIAVANGSAALDIAIQALEIGEGDEVIMPTFTIISPALSVIRAGAVPVLVDSDPFTWNMNVDQLQSRITSKTRAILVVHIYGLPVVMEPVLALAEKYNLYIIEDAAEVIGQTYHGKKCGSFGHISTFSFYPNKHITTGEGGMLLCDDRALAERCRKLRNLAFEPVGRRFVHHELGWNYRMSNLQAALGVAQLEQVDAFLQKKRAMGMYYKEHLSFLRDYGFTLPLHLTDYAANIYWVFGLIAPSENDQEDIVKYLARHHIATRPFFWCMHEQPVFKKMGLFKNESYPQAEKLAKNGFYIPSGLGLRDEDLKLITGTFSDYINSKA